MFESLAAWSADICFVAASVLSILSLQRGGRPPFVYGWSLLLAGGILELLYMVAATVRLGAFPIINPWIGASFLSFLITLFAVLVWLKHREPAFLAGAAPVAAMFAILSASRPVTEADLAGFAEQFSRLQPGVDDAGRQILESIWFPTHVTLALAAYALFALAATMGLLQLALHRALKRKRGVRRIQYLPPLPVVESIGTTSVMIGMACLFVALVIGAYGARMVLQSHWLGDPKELAGLAILLVYGLIEATRVVRGWTGRRTATAHVGAFVMLIVVFLGSSVLAPKLHGF